MPDQSITHLPAGDASAIERCYAGELVILRDFLPTTRLDALVHHAVQRAVQEIAGQTAAKCLEHAGYGQMHEVLNPQQLGRVVPLAERYLCRRAAELSRKAYATGLGIDYPVWVMRQPLLRFQLPYSAALDESGRRSAFVGKYAIGRFNSLRPHRDSWFAEPRDCLNLWVALSPVEPGNGLSFYQDTDGKKLRFHSNQGVTRDQAVGTPMNISLGCGDALIFHAEKLHASELNRTDRTRAVLSLRIALAHPRDSAREPWRYMRIRPDRRLSCARLHPAYSVLTRKLCAARFSLMGHRWSSPDHEVTTPSNAGRSEQGPRLAGKVRLEEIPADRPITAGPGSCLARATDGQVFRFRRYCPHQGADLSLGRLVDDKVICPWHNLPFDLRSGPSACSAVGSLNPKPCKVHEGLVHVEPDRA